MGTLTYPYSLTAGALENVNHLNSNLTAIANVLNGSVEAANIANSTITSAKLAASAKVDLDTATSTSTQAGGAIADITTLSISITPSVAVYYVAFLAASLTVTNNEETADLSIDVDGATAGASRLMFPVASLVQTGTVVAAGTLTAAAHTIKGRYTASSGALTVAPGNHRLIVVTFAQ